MLCGDTGSHRGWWCWRGGGVGAGAEGRLLLRQQPEFCNYRSESQGSPGAGTADCRASPQRDVHRQTVSPGVHLLISPSWTTPRSVYRRELGREDVNCCPCHPARGRLHGDPNRGHGLGWDGKQGRQEEPADSPVAAGSVTPGSLAGGRAQPWGRGGVGGRELQGWQPPQPPLCRPEAACVPDPSCWRVRERGAVPISAAVFLYKVPFVAAAIGELVPPFPLAQASPGLPAALE